MLDEALAQLTIPELLELIRLITDKIELRCKEVAE